MMRTSTIVLTAVLAVCRCIDIQAQKINVPVGALSTYYNGGFAGEAGGLRICAYTYVKPATKNNSYSQAYWGSMASVDHFVKKLRSGVGFTFGQEAGPYQSTSGLLSAAISPKISVKGKYTIAPFADFNYSRHKSTVHEWFQVPQGYSRYQKVDFFQVNAGVLANSSKAYAGLSATIFEGRVNKTSAPMPKDRFTFLDNTRLTFQTGYTFQRAPGSKFSITPQLLMAYTRQNFPQVIGNNTYNKINYITLDDFSLMFRYKKFVSGISRNGLMLGYQTSKFKLLTTNYYTKNAVKGRYVHVSDHTLLVTKPFSDEISGYLGSISLRYVFKNPDSASAGFK
jgi:hypothetical protein